MKRAIAIGAAVVTASLLLTGPVSGAAASFPEQIGLPDGFFPEGIAIGQGTDVYVGSLHGGAIYRASLRTGDGAILAAADAGRVVAGLSYDAHAGLLWGVGYEDGVGAAFGFDGATGELVHTVLLHGAAFPNDVVVARDALYITDSLGDELWSVRLDRRGRPLGPAVATPLGGDFEFVTEGDLPINLNGIDVTPNGHTLIAVHSSLGVLYRIDPTTGFATEIDLGEPAAVASGDGIVLHGHRVYVVQNFANQVAVVDLAPGFATGEVVALLSNELLRIPTTAAVFGDSLYLVNARFDTAFPPFLGGDPNVSIDYDVVELGRI